MGSFVLGNLLPSLGVLFGDSILSLYPIAVRKIQANLFT
jgi:drug/metabolite transporter (DMT)-like permease